MGSSVQPNQSSNHTKTTTIIKNTARFERKTSNEIRIQRNRLNEERELIIADIILYEKSIRDLDCVRKNKTGLEPYLEKKYILITCILETYRKLNKLLKQIFFCSYFSHNRDKKVAERIRIEATLLSQKKLYYDWIDLHKETCVPLHTREQSCVLCQKYVGEYDGHQPSCRSRKEKQSSQ